MTTTIVELDTALRGLRLSEKSVTLQARALQVAAHEMDFVEALLWTVQDELYRRRSRLLDWRYALSGPPARKDLNPSTGPTTPGCPSARSSPLAR